MHMVINMASLAKDLKLHPYWLCIAKDMSNIVTFDKQSFMLINFYFASSTASNIIKTYHVIKSMSCLCSIYLILLQHFYPANYLYPNTLTFECVKEMGNFLTLHLQELNFNLKDSVLK